MTDGRTDEGHGVGPPTSEPKGNPTPISMDHSWTLQAVMEMKKDLGVLVERIDRMREDVGTLTTKVDAVDDKVGKINTKLVWVAGICTGITAIVLIVWAIVTQVPWEKFVADPPVEQPAQVSSSELPPS